MVGVHQMDMARAARMVAGSATERRVLVVEDDEDTLHALSELLSAAGFRPLLAANGREALAVIAREPPDVILTDLMMPEMNGVELLAAVRRREKIIPTILLTGTNDRMLGVRLDVPVVYKPDWESLVPLITRYCA